MPLLSPDIEKGAFCHEAGLWIWQNVVYCSFCPERFGVEPAELPLLLPVGPGAPGVFLLEVSAVQSLLQTAGKWHFQLKMPKNGPAPVLFS